MLSITIFLPVYLIYGYISYTVYDATYNFNLNKIVILQKNADLTVDIITAVSPNHQPVEPERLIWDMRHVAGNDFLNWNSDGI